MGKVFCFFVVFLMVTILSGFGMETHRLGGTAHATETTKVHDGARLVQYDGFIMSVDRSEHFIIVNEIKIIVGQFWAKDTAWVTVLESSNGRMVDFTHFDKGQLVTIRGFAISESEIFAVSMKGVSGYLQKDLPRINKLDRLRF